MVEYSTRLRLRPVPGARRPSSAAATASVRMGDAIGHETRKNSRRNDLAIVW